MARTHVDHGDIARFAQDRVNLPRDKANEYRAQARRLREKLDGYLKEHPDFTLRKMLLSGSLAKGAAPRSHNDMAVACYISSADAPGDIAELRDLRCIGPPFVSPPTFLTEFLMIRADDDFRDAADATPRDRQCSTRHCDACVRCGLRRPVAGHRSSARAAWTRTPFSISR